MTQLTNILRMCFVCLMFLSRSVSCVVFFILEGKLYPLNLVVYLNSNMRPVKLYITWADNEIVIEILPIELKLYFVRFWELGRN